MNNFFQELRRRNVVRVVGAYLVVGWLLVQIATTLEESMQLPAWFDGVVVGLLIVGLFGGYGIRFSESLGLMEEDAAHRMGRLVKKTKKPIIVHSLYGSEKSHPLHLLRYYNIPVYDSLDVAAKCMGALGEYENYLTSYHAKTNFVLTEGAKRKPKAVKIINKAKDNNNEKKYRDKFNKQRGCPRFDSSECL